MAVNLQGVPIVKDSNQNSTDLMKCLDSLAELEKDKCAQTTVLLLGGLSGRLDQTVHTLSLLHKLRKKRSRTFAITDENIAWVLDEGEHEIVIEGQQLGPTCGLLPVGIARATISTTGLRWNLSSTESCFDGVVSTSNQFVDSLVRIKTSAPIWWCIELQAAKISPESRVP